ncbi:MAG: S49 family peptidase [Planctomycetota bacterium]|jgi:protease-4
MSDFDQTSSSPIDGRPGPTSPAAPPVQAAAPAPVVVERRRGWLSMVLASLGAMVIISSLFIILLLLLVAISSRSAARSRGGMARKTIQKGKSDQTIAVYAVEGMISKRATERMEQFRDSVIEDDNVKAVVFRVVSPGGSVSASDQMCRMVRQIKAAGKPVVVSMGAVAASGGYYISAPADTIVAEPTTVTGSIGVIMQYMVLEGTLDKLGMDPMVIKSTHASSWKDMGSPHRRPADRETAYWRSILDNFQDKFEKVVRDGRGHRLNPQTVSLEIVTGEGESAKTVTVEDTEPFNGKIYLADRAKELGLIDTIGYQDDAVAKAAELASLDEPNSMQYSRRRSMMDMLLFGGESAPALRLGTELLDDLQTPQFLMIWKVD